MGVPKFYRWISERYPCLSEVVKEFQLPEFDNLYLDMNGVVHVCSHPEDDNPHFRITEEQIFKDICHYIEFLFRMIKPKKVFFMAIDGVAPRAKMNQQRGRRFRSAREAEELIKKAQEKGEVLPTEKRFDSNCITPGTPFMKRLQDHLKYFVVNKVTFDPLWQGPKIILSGHETPGEGEHKVMDYIRYSRSQPGHDPNTRHCLYGLDADLIMLGLTSHEPHFALLREEVKFGGKKDRNKRPTTPEETTFHLLHLSLMREYLDYEFSPLREKLSFAYDVEKIIDDWILMGFLVGNDFIPHLPHLHIHHDALPLLWKTYMDILPTLDGYLNEGGHLNLKRFEKYIGALANFDREQFSDTYVDMKYLEGKRGGVQAQKVKHNGGAKQKKKPMRGDDNSFAALAGLGEIEPEDEEEENRDVNRRTEQSNLVDLSNDPDEDSDDYDTFDEEFSAHKRDYYMTKMEYENVTPEVLRSQAYEYVRAIQWILLYYYEGVQSWSWYYPHHYAPYISDVRDFSEMVMRYDMSEPFKPFEQLMAVLPAASKELMPPCLQELMTNDSSPVIDYYPVNFKTDLNGKQQDWEAVVLIPFIDENKLLSAIRTKEQYLTPEQRQRNSHGPCYQYQYSPEQQGVYPSPMPGAFPDIAASRCKIEEIHKFGFCLQPDRIRKGLLAGTLLDTYFPGFPTLKNIPHDHGLEKQGVKVFQMNSRSFNMMLKIKDLPQRPLQDIANDLLGQVTWVGWPHLHEAKVYAVADEQLMFEIEERKVKGQATPSVQWKRKELTKDDLDNIYKDAAGIKEKYHDRFGVEVGRTTVLIYCGSMTGRKYVYTSHGQVTAEKQFNVNRKPFALQATCKDVLTHAPDDMHFRTIDELFPIGAAVFMLGHPHYASQGEVLEIDQNEGRVRVNFNVLQEPNLSAVFQGQQYEQDQYMPVYIAHQRIGMSKHLLSRITGTILILRGDGGNQDSKANIGLNLKFTKRGEEVPGYTKKTDEGWLYSDRCLQVINDYMNKFYSLWEYIAQSSSGANDIYTELELFPPEETEYTLKDVLKYLEELPCSKVTSMKSGANIVGDVTIMAIERAVDEVTELNKTHRKKVKMQVKPHILFRPLPNQGLLEPDPGTQFEMLDRIVVVKMGYSVPFGLRGTVVGIHPGEGAADTMFDVIFDQEFAGGIMLRCSSKRGYRVPAMAMLNLSYGDRKHTRQNQTPQQQRAAAAPAYNAWQQPRSRQGQGRFQGQGQSQGQGSSYSALVRQEQQRGANAGGYMAAANRQPEQAASYSYASPPQQPQFVTPKFATTNANVRPARPQQNRGPAPVNLPPSDTNDFTNIWNQLLMSSTAGGAPLPRMPQNAPTGVAIAAATTPIATSSTSGDKQKGGSQSSKAKATSKPTTQPTSKPKAAFDDVSLASAAAKLRDLIDLGPPTDVPEDILVDLGDHEASAAKGHQRPTSGENKSKPGKSENRPSSAKGKGRKGKGEESRTHSSHDKKGRTTPTQDKKGRTTPTQDRKDRIQERMSAQDKKDRTSTHDKKPRTPTQEREVKGKQPRVRVITNSSHGQNRDHKGAGGAAPQSGAVKPSVLDLFEKASQARKSHSPSSQLPSKSPVQATESPAQLAQSKSSSQASQNPSQTSQSKSPAQLQTSTQFNNPVQFSASTQLNNPAQMSASSHLSTSAEGAKPKSPGLTSDKVQAMFEQAQLAQKSGDVSVASSEFNALFAALQLAPKTTTSASGTMGIKTTPAAATTLSGVSEKAAGSEDHTEALKQMLKIGMGENHEEESQEQTAESKKSYGRQVSIQELFDVAKQAPPAHPDSSASQAQQWQQQQHQQQQQQQQLQQQQQQARLPQSVANPMVPPPQAGILGVPNRPRNPTDELAAICQLSGQGMPKYEFNFHAKQKGFIASVQIPGGARFEGSLSSSKEEAAESAASMAMLCLRQAQQMSMGGAQRPPWMQRGPAPPGMNVLRPGPRLFSPNSAFSPVVNPLLQGFNPAMFAQPPPHLLPPGQRGRQPLMSQPPPLRPFPNQPPPGGRPHLPANQQQGQYHPTNQQYQSANQQYHQPANQQGQHHPTNQQQGHNYPANQQPPTSHAANQNAPEAGPRHPGANQDGEEAEPEQKTAAMMKSSTEAFIPLQVVRKQRRKEETPEKQQHQQQMTNPSTSSATDTPHHPHTPAAHTHTPDVIVGFGNTAKHEAVNGNPLLPANGVVVRDGESKTGGQVASPSSPPPPPSATRRKESGGDVASKTPTKETGGGASAGGSGKKRRPRIAANFSKTQAN